MAGFKKGGKGGKPQNYAKGGQVSGPGTGTSDDVEAQVKDGSYVMPADSTAQIGPEQLASMGTEAPVDVNLSNGEQVLPPEQVQAIGVQALDQMKQATHTPARGFQPQAQPPTTNPELFFADGGEVRKKTQFGRTFADELAARGVQPHYAPPAGAPPAVAQPTGGFPTTPPAGNPPAVAQSQPHYVPPGGDPPAVAKPAAGFQAPQPAAGPPAYARPTPAPLPVVVPPAYARPATETPQMPAAAQPLHPALPQTRPPAGAPPAYAQPTQRGYYPNAQMQASGSPMNPALPSLDRQPPAPNAPTHDWQADPDAAGWRLKAVVDGTKARVGELVDQGQYARGVGALARGSLAGFPALAADAGQLVGDLASPVVSGVASFGKELFGMQDQAPAAAMAATQPQAQPNAAPSPAAAQSQPAAPQPAALPADYAKPVGFSPIPKGGAERLVKPEQQTVMTQNAPDPGPTVLTGDKYRIGGKDSVTATADQWGDATNVITGSREAMDNNLRAIQIMQSGNPGGQAVAPRPRGFTRIHQGEGGGSAASQAALSAASTPYRDSPNGQLTAAQIRALNDMTQNDQNNANYLERARIEQEGAYDRAAMQEAGAYDRASIQEQGQNARFAQSNDLDRLRTNIEVQQKGFGIRSGQRLEKLYQQYEAAKPEERAAIAEQIQVLTGKDSPNRYTVVPGGQQWNAEAGTVLTQPSMVINNQTGQFIDQGRPQAQAPVARPVGTRSTVNGKTAVWDGNQWIPQ